MLTDEFYGLKSQENVLVLIDSYLRDSEFEVVKRDAKLKTSLSDYLKGVPLSRKMVYKWVRGTGGTWVSFGWVCAARETKFAPRSKKYFP